MRSTSNTYCSLYISRASSYVSIYYLCFVPLWDHSFLDNIRYIGGKLLFCDVRKHSFYHLIFSYSFFCRSPNWNSKNVAYEGLDGDKNLYVTFLAASEFIQSAIEKVSGKKCFPFFYSFLEKRFWG